ncbi:MAG: LytTR family DNA-binding domain-containing protein, partial [Bacteroidota bacterium]|nr:LytTR family DNA-binding domain-containing protein [Bacteroidota bacterium]
DIDFLHLVAEFDSPLKAAPLIQEGKAQLIFLDIQMPKITGLQFMKTLQTAPPVIFTTAYPQYALEGFELNALDYLVKPISFERFFKAALRAKEFYELRLANLPTEEKQEQDYFFIKADNKLVKIFFDDFLFAEALQNYVAIYTKTKKYVTYLTFKSLEEFLPADAFIKTHKSFLVAAARIDNIDGNEVRIGEHRIPISRTLHDALLDKLLKGRFLKR